jgi:hypothetical protein
LSQPSATTAVPRLHRFASHGRKLSAVACSLLICIVAAACDKKVSDESQALAKTLHSNVYPPAPAPARSSGSTRPRIFIDASLSMSGYVTGTPGGRTAFDAFIDKLSEYLPGAGVYKFGQGNDQKLLSPANFDRNLHSPAFYNLTYNPNDLLIDQLNSEEQPGLSIIVTDGVQSDYSGQGNHPVVESVRRWMERGGTFGIIILKSRFEGPFWTELGRGWIGGGQRVSIPDRPFYAFVLSPSPHEFDELKDKALRDFPGSQVISFDEGSLGCQVTTPPDGKRPYQVSPAEEQFFWQRFEADLFEKGSSSANLSYEVTCKADSTYPVKELSFACDASCFLWNGQAFGESAAPLPDGFACEFKTGPSREETQVSALRVLVPKDARSKFSFYVIKGSAGLRGLRDDITQLNTEDDSDLRNASKTYKLTSLIAALASVQMKTRLARAVSPTVYLTIRN